MLRYTNSDERLTADEIRAKYPNGWVGLQNVEYKDDGMSIISAVVICYDETCREIDMLHIHGKIQDRLRTKDATIDNLTMLTIPQVID